MNGNELTQAVQGLLAQGKVEDAFDLLQNAIDANPKFVEAWMLLGAIYRATGQLDKATEVCIRAIKIIPEISTIWNNLGQLYIEQGLYDQAIQPIKTGLSIDPKNSSAWYSFGQVLVMKELFSQAIEAFEKAVKLAPKRVELWKALGSAYDDNKQYKDSIKAYKKALGLQPDSFDAMVGLGMVYINAGDFKEAIKVYEKCLKVEPNNEVLWFRIGTAFSNVGKLDQAIKAIEKGLKLNPTIVKAWMDLHEVFKKKGDKKKAKWALEKAMGTGKMDVKFAQNVEEAQSKIVEWEDKQKTRKTEQNSLVEITDEEINKLYEEAFKRRYQPNKALKLVKKILDMDPNHIDAMLLKAGIFKRKLKRSKAVKLVRKTIALKPNYAKSFVLLAELTMNITDYKSNMEAMRIIDTAIEKDPRSDDAWALKGLLYSYFKHRKKVRPCLDKALNINPNNKRARTLIAHYRTSEEEESLYKEIVQGLRTARGSTSNFLNPRIRKEKFAKHLGFDPIAFAPLDQDNMVYIHMDGNENNDDPATHGWVSKESYEQLKSGSLFKGAKSEIGKQRKLIEQHFETYLGGVDKILDDNRGDKYHIDIYILPPNDKRDYGVMATSGMSDFGMHMPPKLQFFQYGELYVK